MTGLAGPGGAELLVSQWARRQGVSRRWVDSRCSRRIRVASRCIVHQVTDASGLNVEPGDGQDSSPGRWVRKRKMNATNPSSDLLASLQRILRRRRCAFAIALGGPILAPLFWSLVPAKNWHGRFLVEWIVAFLVSSTYAFESRCFRCCRRFHGNWLLTAFLAQRCRYCGLSASDLPGDPRAS